ncbi:MAG TPA: hypothetical protein VGM05_28160 [Planctomycetaceae bacterium]|jgi:hypothetical protein
MRRKLADYRGTLTALSLLLVIWLAGICVSPDDWKPTPRRLFNSDNKFVGWGSDLERSCRRIPEVHDLLWQLPIFT